ncbi:MAG: hypothetical protein HOI35_10665 [Woeseia sp.]|jgi:hypothetical protein|nr:hypothetical protein [Woeseia sp.]
MTASATPEFGPSIGESEALDVNPDTFNHSAHMFVAWSYLQHYDLATSIQRYRKTLMQLTRKFDVPDKFHETITWFYLITIAERIEEHGTDKWRSFVRTNSNLFTTKPSLISQFCSNELIASDRARRAFLLPPPYLS